MSIIKKIMRFKEVFFPTRKNLGGYGSNTYIEFPVYILCQTSVFMEADTRLRGGTKILCSEHSSVTIKQYTVVGMNCMIIPNKHTSTVGIPQILLGISGINDSNNDVVIGEDVWIGSNVTIMGNVNVGRGCICGACSLVTKSIPPYAIVVGSPAKIIGVKFSIDQIIEHEKVLYSEEKRLSRDYLEELFKQYYSNVRIFGVTTDFTPEHIERLKLCARKRKFTKKDYFEKLSNLNKNV